MIERIFANDGMPVLIGADLRTLQRSFASADWEDSELKLALLDQVAVLVSMHVGTSDNRGYRMRIDSLDFPAPSALMAYHALRAHEKDASKARDTIEKQPDVFTVAWGSPNTSGTKVCDGIPETKLTDIPDNVETLSPQSRLFRGIFSQTSWGKKALELDAPYHDSSCVSDLVTPTNTEDNGSKDLFGKYLFLGTEIDIVEEQVNVPLRGSLPGINVHAMAFDNILSLDETVAYTKETNRELHWLLITFIMTMGLRFILERFGLTSKSNSYTSRLEKRQLTNFESQVTVVVLILLVPALTSFADFVYLQNPLIDGMSWGAFWTERGSVFVLDVVMFVFSLACLLALAALWVRCIEDTFSRKACVSQETAAYSRKRSEYPVSTATYVLIFHSFVIATLFLFAISIIGIIFLCLQFPPSELAGPIFTIPATYIVLNIGSLHKALDTALPVFNE
ncbi:MAG: hypothetical protein AAGI72_09755 [Pseudomonadota bacterium]